MLIWREIQANSWQIIYEYSGHVKSGTPFSSACLFRVLVSSVCWAPVEYGLELACSSTDGYISILAFNKGFFILCYLYVIFQTHGHQQNSLLIMPE